MNPSYKQTFSRHKVLFSLPAAIMALFAIWFVLGTPSQYKAAASLWVDTPAPGPSSLNETNTSELPPAAQAQQLLAELLATRQFRLDVGHKGPLSKYYAQHPSEGWGPKGLLRKLRGTGSVDDRTAAALDPKHVITAVAGPQVLELASQGMTNPEIARRLELSVHAIKFHLASVYRKLGAANRTEAAVAWALTMNGQAAAPGGDNFSTPPAA